MESAERYGKSSYDRTSGVSPTVRSCLFPARRTDAVGHRVPQQVEPVSTPSVDDDGEQCSADEVEQGAGRINRQRNVNYLQNRQRLLIEVLQIEQSSPE